MKRRPVGQLIAAILVFVALVAAIAIIFWPAHNAIPRKPPQTQSKPAKPTAPPLPPIPKSPYANAAQDVSYVGTERCVSCHADQHASYLTTAHSRSMTRIDTEGDVAEGAAEAAEVIHALSFHRYHNEFDGELEQREELALADGRSFPINDYKIEYAVGSGHFAQSYLTRVEDYLVESPLTWYSRKQAWGMSPGYDVRDQSSFQRAISEDCLFCHAGQTQLAKENPFHVTVLETAIGCERCHGPGALHVAQQEAGKSASGDVDHSIVNPSRLSRELAEAICQQCHLQSDASVAVRGRGRSHFRPGLPLAAFEAVFRQPTDDPEMSVVGHVEQLHLSLCWQQTATLTCTTCHRPHHDGPDDRAWYRSRCLECHANESCSEPLPARIERADNDCIACHMPQVPTEVTHVAFTHHRIGVHPPRTPIDAGSSNDLIAVQNLELLSPPDQERCRGLAHALLMPQSKNAREHATHLSEASRALQQVYDEGLRDPAVTAALAEVAKTAGLLPNAERLAAETIAATEAAIQPRVQALRVLGDLHFQQRRYAEAATAFRELVTARYNARDAFFLGLCEQRLGHREAAIAAFERSVRIDRLQVGSRTALVTLYKTQAQPQEADEQQLWIDRLTGK